ncbi:hypothetical protein DPV78_003948 [Talaromyces pinophilus]|nr:hypothetical protein DPV78_003948 [Talaromyces pinophilus]
MLVTGSFHDIQGMTWRAGYFQPLAVLPEGAPVMREMLQRILTQVCILGERCVVWTVSPGQQWYVAAIQNLVDISVGVVHTDIDLKDRHDHHGFRSDGTNMQKDCHNVHLFDYPPAMTTIHQAVGRVRRFRKNHVIKVFYYGLKHSISFELFIRRTNQSTPTARAATNEGCHWAVDYYTMDNIEPAVFQHLAIYVGRQGRLVWWYVLCSVLLWTDLTKETQMPEDEESDVDQLYINRLSRGSSNRAPQDAEDGAEIDNDNVCFFTETQDTPSDGFEIIYT